MTFFQNLLTSDFEGNWLLADRHHIPTFRCPHNSGRGDEIVTAWKPGPYDLSGTDADGTTNKDLLSVTFALNNDKNWGTIQVEIGAGAGSLSAVTPQEIMANLNSDAIFGERFHAYLGVFGDTGGDPRIIIKQLKPAIQMKFFINNGGAEEVLRFNAKAGIGELPTYFDRHSFDSRFTFDDSTNHLLPLDPDGSTVDANIIDNAVDFRGVSLGLDSGKVKEDWKLLEGRSGLFDFTNVVDGSTTIIYHAGAKVGDLAKKIVIDSGNTFVLPHTLASDDLITPP